MLPTVHKHLLVAVSAVILGLLAAGPAHAAKTPRISTAYTQDSDGDGHVDSVSLRWSQGTRGGFDTKAPFAFSVRGYRVRSVGGVVGRAQLLRVAEKRDCDVGGSVKVAYAKPDEKRLRVRGARSHAVDMRRFDPPVPRITCATTLDADRDAHVDGVRLTYSRAIRNRAQTSGRFLFSVSGYRVKAVRAAKGRFLRLDLAERTAPDSGATPTIAYARPVNTKQKAFAVRSGSRGSSAFTGTFQGTRDGVGPVLLRGETGDADRDGLLDAMNLRFSEPVRGNGSTGLSVFGQSIMGVSGYGGAGITLALAEGAALGDARPVAWITPGVPGGITDAAGNGAVAGTITPADAAPPVMLAAVTEDTGGVSGRIDALSVWFSEPVAHARDGGGDYPFLVGGRRIATVEPSVGNIIQLKLVEGSAPDTGDRPSIRHIPGPGLPVLDAAGNTAAEGLVNPIDAVAPVLLSATTADDDADGRIDRVVYRFSEPVHHAAESATSSFSIAGYGVLQAAAANGSDVSVGLVEGSGPDSGTRPASAYRRDGSEDVRDPAGNTTPDSSLPQAQDGAPPVLISAQTTDADDDGRLDGLATTWSEPLVHADDSAAPFPVSTSVFAVARVRAASGQNLTIDLTEPSGHDTGSRPALTYAGGSDPIRDASGLEPAKRTWDGVTADALAPRVVSATTGDTDEDGSLDSMKVRFSENVQHAQETTQSSFTVAGATILSAEAAAGDTVELKLQETGSGDTGLRPAMSYSPDGQEDVRDASANFAPSATITQSTDGARPILRSAATADVDDDGRLDRITTSWSEPLVHADDSSAPFPLSAGGFTVARVHAAAGDALDVDLTEPNSADTGSAPTLTYAGGADPIRDASALEAAQKTYSGQTRDALPPRLVQIGTADLDSDGRLDATEIEWSEQVTGSTGSGPYTVSGRAIGANVTFSGSTTRIPFTEDGSQHDTHATPVVSYDAGLGDLHDIAEGTGDVTAAAPAVTSQTALDKAPPILVAAKTADIKTPATPNGTIDAVLTTFSEPIAHSVDGIAPFSLNVAGRTEESIEGDSGSTDRTLYVRVAESSAPDGGDKPNVSVVAAGPVADRIKDRAATPNEAKVMTFSDTSDEVRPVLMAAQLGERDGGGSCTKDAVAGIDGEVDCVLATWSEDVQHAADSDGDYPISSSNWGIPGTGIGTLGPAKTLPIPLTASTTKDRDKSGTTLTYDDARDLPVVDLASPPNESLSGTKTADPACRDTGLEGNDALNTSTNPPLATTSPSFQRKCAFDDDWYKVSTAGSPDLEIVTRPANDVNLQFALYTAAGTQLTPSSVVETGNAGQVDRVKYDSATSGLAASTTYYLRVTATETPTPQEGPYCVVFSDNAAVQPGCGPLVGQIVFTEVGFGIDKFVEIKNDFDVPVEMAGAGAKLIIGPLGSGRECTLTLPTGSGQSIVDPNEHMIVEQTNSATTFGCNQISSLSPGGERVELSASGSIDVVDFGTLINSGVAAEHSVQFVEDDLTEDHVANDDIATRWCRTFAADTKNAVGDGCDEYRINEVLWRPASTSAASDGKYFVEIGGNIPAKANSALLGGWVVRGVNGLTGDGSSDFVLPAGASPRTNGTFVIADGVSGVSQVSDFDEVWNSLDLSSSQWPDATGTPGPRGLQLLRPNPGSAPPCTSSADAFGWTTTAQGFTIPLDDLRSCPGLEGQEYTNNTVGASAARDNLSSSGDTTYNVGRDSGNNRLDFCPQASPNPGQLNIRASC